jgi:branched-chain amino acid transport system substrate-binding protein
MIKFIISIFIILLFTSCETEEKILASGKKVYIDVLASQSGDGIAYGLQGLQGLLAAKELKPFLPNGDEIVFNIYDDKSKTDNAKSYVKSIDKNITALLTFCSSAIELSIVPEVLEVKIPTLAVIATHDDFTKLNKYMTRLSMSNSKEAEVSAFYIRDDMLLDSVGVIYSENSLYSKSIANYFIKKFKQLDGQVLIDRSIESFNERDLNYQEFLDNLNLDIIFLTTDAILSYKFLEVFNTLDTKVKIFATDGLLSDMQKHYPNKLDILNGVLTIDHYSDNMIFNEHAMKIKGYFKKRKMLLSSFAGLGYESYQMLYNALERCSSYKRECINNNFRNSKLFDGVVSSLQTVDGDMQRPLYINEIQNAKMIRKVKVY